MIHEIFRTNMWTSKSTPMIISLLPQKTSGPWHHLPQSLLHPNLRHLTHQALNNNGQLNAIYKGILSTLATKLGGFINIPCLQISAPHPQKHTHTQTLSSTKEPINSIIIEDNNYCTPNTPLPSPTPYLLHNTLTTSSLWYTSGHTHHLHLCNLKETNNVQKPLAKLHQKSTSPTPQNSGEQLVSPQHVKTQYAHQPLSFFLRMMLILKNYAIWQRSKGGIRARGITMRWPTVRYSIPTINILNLKNKQGPRVEGHAKPYYPIHLGGRTLATSINCECTLPLDGRWASFT